MRCSKPLGLVLALVTAATSMMLVPAAAQAPKTTAPAAKPAAKPWTVPRTADGKPDLQGNWSNATQTPIERIGKDPLVITEEQAKAVEARARLLREHLDEASDPNRPPLQKGGGAISLPPGDPSFIERIAVAAGGAVGGYNGFWLDPGERVIMIDGHYRSSIIVDPPDGRLPPVTAEGKRIATERAKLASRFREFDHPEVRPLSDRCLVSFGSNLGPPMLPNYFYNNNYQIVQTKDHVMIMTEMVHDVRVIRIGGSHAPKTIQQWFGDSIGRWEADTLVVETTNFHPMQVAPAGFSPLSVYRGWSDTLKITERFTRTGPDTILYKFTVEDPTIYTAPFSGELPFNRSEDQIFEYACHEGNYALSNILSGARAKEREEAQKKQQQ